MAIAQLPNTGQRAAAQVAAITAFHARIPFRKTIRHASHTRSESDNVVVECRLDDGTVGYGEGAPRDYVTGETIETSLDLLRRTDWAGQLRPVESFQEAVDLARRLMLPPAPGDDRGCIGNAARCAAELALLDAFGKRFGHNLVDVAAHLPDCSEIYQFRPSCRYSGAITSRSRFREFVSAVKLRLVRFKHCKIKVGTPGQDDPARMRMFRLTFGKRLDFRIDANEAWTPDNVVEKILELEPYGITSVEQPVPHEDVGCLVEARKLIHTPIMLDESVCSRLDAQRAIEAGTCDLFNIRLSKCGGLIPSLELAALADRYGLGYQLGCQIGETGILSAAGRSFACSVKGIRYCEGSYDRWLVRERLTRELMTFRWRGIADALTDPGLGVTVEPARLASVTVSSDRLYG